MKIKDLKHLFYVERLRELGLLILGKRLLLIVGKPHHYINNNWRKQKTFFLIMPTHRSRGSRYKLICMKFHPKTRDSLFFNVRMIKYSKRYP